MVVAKKALGQNFLMHRQTAARIVQAANLPERSYVLEIGPGTGMLTHELLLAGHRVLAIETDASLIPELETRFSKAIAAGNLTLLHEDVREFNPKERISEPYHLVANIPYYITGELFRQFLSAEHQPKSMTVLVQKEVAERIARSKKGSLLSLSVQAYGTPTLCFTVPRGAFTPAPKVDSAVLHIAGVSRGAFSSRAEEECFFELIRAGFSQKRKQLFKNLSGVCDATALEKAFEELSLLKTIRAEDVPLSSWLSLARVMKHSREK